MSLAALTATYTDSEDDDEVVRPEPPNPEDNTTDSVSEAVKFARLVSYGEPEDDEERHDSSLNITDEKVNEDGERWNYSFVRERTKSTADENIDSDIVLPPDPQGHCSPQLQEKIASLYEKKSSKNLNMTASIQKRKDFRNPSIYEKLIQFCGIDELGTNYPTEIYNPHKWDGKSYYDELAKTQRAVMEKREKDKKAKVEFQVGTAKRSTTEICSAEDSKKRKSKWDVVTGQASTAVPVKAEGPTFVPLVNASGNKGAVISAFGNINKKPK